MVHNTRHCLMSIVLKTTCHILNIIITDFTLNTFGHNNLPSNFMLHATCWPLISWKLYFSGTNCISRGAGMSNIQVTLPDCADCVSFRLRADECVSVKTSCWCVGVCTCLYTLSGRVIFVSARFKWTGWSLQWRDIYPSRCICTPLHDCRFSTNNVYQNITTKISAQTCYSCLLI